MTCKGVERKSCSLWSDVTFQGRDSVGSSPTPLMAISLFTRLPHPLHCGLCEGGLTLIDSWESTTQYKSWLSHQASHKSSLSWLMSAYLQKA